MNERIRLSISTERYVAGAIVRVVGRMDVNNADQLETVVEEQFEDGQSVLVFDLTDLSYISSSGLRVLLKAARDSACLGGKSVFFGLCRDVATVLSVRGLDRVLDIFDNQDGALRALQSRVNQRSSYRVE